MTHSLDETDRRILRVLQRDAASSLDRIAEDVALSRNACWRRIRRMEDAGVIRGRVALLDAGKVGLGLAAFVMIRAGRHDADWLDRFARAVRAMPEIQGAHRMSGDLDYVLRVRVRDMADYDRFYRALIARVPIADVSASFVMEDLVDGTALPV
ncbi:Lrp/AsnC family transcriptional regulator [Jannaschia sp. W003]|uniref:Lrp/AsnC family transcriptional regulator n=1 Tax=Jannaschia sp. W003 TaxID=2867012 RepID=UPI0021A55A96|nr:Lrp/AsnC family transcriptional regulator [Jannaschia sp. W003]UWQ22348.1 Lrp/AsnC family transcriptional regulator [Jannaschia sp. W003]